MSNYRREAAFQNLALYHRSSPGCHRVRFARLFEATQFFEATYKNFEIFCESVILLEKPKSGEISDVLVLKVDDRGATATPHTPYFQVASLCSIPHGSYIDSSDSPVIVPMTNTVHLEPLHASRPPAIS